MPHGQRGKGKGPVTDGGERGRERGKEKGQSRTGERKGERERKERASHGREIGGREKRAGHGRMIWRYLSLGCRIVSWTYRESLYALLVPRLLYAL